MILTLVRSALNNHEVFNRVVKAVPINVMHMLIGKQFSTERLLHHPTMFAHRLAIPRNVSIPQPIGRFIDSLAIVFKPALTSGRTKETGLPKLDLLTRPVDGRAAGGAVHKHNITHPANSIITREAFQYHTNAHQDRCGVCRYWSGPQGCGLYRMINQRMPEDFALNEKVVPDGWCSAFVDRKAKA